VALHEAGRFCVAISPGKHSTSNDHSFNPSMGRGASAVVEGTRGKAAGRQYQAAKICTNISVAVQTSH